MLKIIFSTFFLTTCFISFGQNTAITDGPYLFYRADSLTIQCIANGKLETELYSGQKKMPASINVPVPGKAGVLLTVPLKKKIENEPSEFKAAEKLFVTSDIEGEFIGFEKLLLAGGVINKNFNWTFGTGHLVVCGDLFDRGEEVTACLWLLYKLEEEAKAAGGYVHVIIGNHEVMNLSEDVRYVHPKYISAATLMNRNYTELYAANTELGRWLRTKNIMERIGKNLFLHGGVSQAVNDQNHSLKKINNLVRPLYELDGLDSILNAANAMVYFNNLTSPFWYRGYFAPPLASMAQVDSTLKVFDVNKIIVGHTIVDSIQSIYNGKIIAIDVNHHKQNHQVLFIEQDSFYRMTAEGKKTKLN
ncbi:MAG: metallophosphoesterase [Bacteroidota bacterium]